MTNTMTKGAADIFADVNAGAAITKYHVKMQCRGLIVGGVPSDPSVIRKWLTTRMDLSDTALDELLAETIKARTGPMTAEEKIDAIVSSEHAPSINGFKRNETGELCYEGRCMKSAIKESANSAFPGTDYLDKGKAPFVSPRKGLMSTLAERVFVYDELIGLGVHSPTRVEERIKHVTTAQGPRSSINLVEVVEKPTLEFTMGVHDDFLSRAAWGRLMVRLEDIGIGADRGRSDGMFDLLEFTQLS